MFYTINAKEEIEEIAKNFILSLEPKNSSATVVGLYGDLGAGKTTFTQSVAKVMGINEVVVSPTFVIEKIYELTNQKFSHLIHIDAYRLESSNELINLGWDKLISDPRNLILIEWPERVASIMPEHIKIHIKHTGNENAREIEVMV